MSIQPLPEGSVLLHIGPRKTATTGIQAGLASGREGLASFGVAYPEVPDGPSRNAYDRTRAASPSWAVLRTSPPGFDVPDIGVWDKFAASVRAAAEAGMRVCVSSETFANTVDPEITRRIIGDLGGDDVHVVYAARALHRLLPSHWQQEVKVQLETRRYDEWLRVVLSMDDPSAARRAFWYAHDVEATMTAWLSATRASNLTVIASDDSDRRLIPQTVERLLGLPDGFLHSESSRANPSLGADEVEVLRLLNAAAREQEWPLKRFTTLQRAATRGLASVERSTPAHRPAAVPQWAVAEVERLSKVRRDAIEGSGARVVGDLDLLLLPADARDADFVPTPSVVSAETTARTLVATIAAGLRELERADRRIKRSRAQSAPAAAPQPADLRYRSLVGELVRRPFRRH